MSVKIVLGVTKKKGGRTNFCKKLEKGNNSSIYKDNMACRLCTSGKNETQEHLEKCEFTKDIRKNLDLVLWRKMTGALKDIYEPKKM